MKRRFLPIGALIAFIGSGALPCHSGPLPAAAQSTTAPLEIRVTLREWSLSPSQINVPAGSAVRFLAQNAGFLPHALTVEGQGLFAESATAGAGDTVRLDVHFPAAGTYDLYCPVNAGEHRALGQEGRLRVLAGISSLALPPTGEPPNPRAQADESSLPQPDALPTPE